MDWLFAIATIVVPAVYIFAGVLGQTPSGRTMSTSA